MIGLYSGTYSKLVVLSGILTIAIADAVSDALGIHSSEESENKHISREIWESTISTFLSKFVFALTFAIPVLLFEFTTAIIISITWGLSVLSVLSCYISREQKVKPWKVLFKHLIIAVVVIIITYYTGSYISTILRFKFF